MNYNLVGRKTCASTPDPCRQSHFSTGVTSPRKARDMRTTKKICILICICPLIGCDRLPAVKNWLPTKLPGKTVVTDSVNVVTQTAQDYAERLRKRDRERRMADLIAADQQLARWAGLLRDQDERHEGLTEPDPWGTMITANYSQDWFYEIITIRSAGPDGVWGTVDDMKRSSRRLNPWGVHQGLGATPWLLLVWVVCGPIALALSQNRRSRSLKGSKRRPTASSLIILFISPGVVLIYMAAMLVRTVGHALSDDGPDLSGLLDIIDIDL